LQPKKDPIIDFAKVVNRNILLKRLNFWGDFLLVALSS
jgi:hypothetical protein